MPTDFLTPKVHELRLSSLFNILNSHICWLSELDYSLKKLEEIKSNYLNFKNTSVIFNYSHYSLPTKF